MKVSSKGAWLVSTHRARPRGGSSVPQARFEGDDERIAMLLARYQVLVSGEYSRKGCCELVASAKSGARGSEATCRLLEMNAYCVSIG